MVYKKYVKKRSKNKILVISGFLSLIVLLLVLGNINYTLSGRVVEDVIASTGDKIIANQINDKGLSSSIDMRDKMNVDVKDSFFGNKILEFDTGESKIELSFDLLNQSEFVTKSIENELEVESFDINVEESSDKYKWGYDVRLNDLNFMARIDVSSDKEIVIIDNQTFKIGDSYLSFMDLVERGFEGGFDISSFSATLANTNDLMIGANSSASSFFNGSIDEIRIWNRTLSADEIYQQYASNLNKFNSTQWYLYVNQSQNVTEGLDDGTYTYFVSAKDVLGNENITLLRSVIVGDSPASLVRAPTANVTYGGGVANTPLDFSLGKSSVEVAFGGGGGWRRDRVTSERILASVTLRNDKNIPLNFEVGFSENLKGILRVIDDSFILKPGEERVVEVVVSEETLSKIRKDTENYVDGSENFDAKDLELDKVLEGIGSGYMEIKSGIQVKQIPVTFTSKIEEVQIESEDNFIETIEKGSLNTWDLFKELFVVILILIMVGGILFNLRKELVKSLKSIRKSIRKNRR